MPARKPRGSQDSPWPQRRTVCSGCCGRSRRPRTSCHHVASTGEEALALVTDPALGPLRPTAPVDTPCVLWLPKALRLDHETTRPRGPRPEAAAEGTSAGRPTVRSPEVCRPSRWGQTGRAWTVETGGRSHPPSAACVRRWEANGLGPPCPLPPLSGPSSQVLRLRASEDGAWMGSCARMSGSLPLLGRGHSCTQLLGMKSFAWTALPRSVPAAGSRGPGLRQETRAGLQPPISTPPPR